jgi:putative Mg2+ transporter-C (MgtC) family protein
MTPLHWEILARVVIGTALGALIGWERDRHGRPAGLRTHLIVAVASTTFMVVSIYFMRFQHYPDGQHISVDPSRIAASIVMGIGFLGGGAILRTGLNVQGLTTAAGLWLVAAIGMAAGSGMYLLALVATAIGLLALTVLRRFERKDDDDVLRRKISLVLGDGAPPVSSIVNALGDRGAFVSPAEYEKQIEGGQVSVTLEARFPAAATDAIVELLEAQPGVRRVRIEPLT